MKELMKKIKNNKGVSLITLTVAVSILIIITGTLIYSTKDTIEIRNLKNMYDDIELLEDKVDEYYIKYGGIPGNLVYTNTGFLEDILKGPDKTEGTGDDSLDAGNYYVIDLVSLEGITSLNYGRDYEDVKDKTTLTTDECINYTDLYIINQETHQIYYVRGIESDGGTYHTNELKIHRDVNMKITVIDSIEDLVRFEQKVNGTYKENANTDPEEAKTFAGENVVLTKNLNFEDNNSYDGSTVIITIDETDYEYKLNDEANDLKTYLCEGDNGTGWTPIGNYTNATTNKPFSGTFNGNDYEISNIYINNTSNYQGLFGYNEGIIKNLSVSGAITAYQTIAGIVASNSGTLLSCTNKVTVKSISEGTTSGQTGGIAGSNSGIIESCVNIGKIEGGSNLIGGIVGNNSGGTVTKCYNLGNVTLDKGNASSASCCGGIVGINFTSSSLVELSYNLGTIIGKNNEDSIGGIVGRNRGNCINCYNIADIEGKIVGGIIGHNQSNANGTGNCRNCYNIGKITGSSSVGAIIGYKENSATCTNTYYLVGTASYGIGDASSESGDQGSDEGAESKTSDFMKTMAFVKLLGTDNWKISNIKNDGYPILEWQEGNGIEVAWYDQNGLILHYDGIENTSNGHSNTATTWYDLSGNKNNATITEANWQNNNFNLTVNNYATFTQNSITKKINESECAVTYSFVIEASSSIIENSSISGNRIVFGDINTYAAFGFYNTGYAIVSCKPTNPLTNEIKVFKLTKFNVNSKNKIDIVYDKDNNSEIVSLYVNGNKEDKANGATDSLLYNYWSWGDNKNYIGRRSTGTEFEGNLYNFMVYNKALSQDEVIANYKFDKSRFGF